MSVKEQLKKLGIELPEPPSPVGSYTPALRTGNLLYLSGILPFHDGKLIATGVVGEEVSLEAAQEAARQVVINALSVVDSVVGLDRVSRCVRLQGYVASSRNFYDQPLVLNAASDLLREVFGDRGIHTRVAVGVYCLPLNSPVEIDFIFEIADL